MSEIVNQSLQKVAKGTVIILVGGIISLLLSFVVLVIIVRNFTVPEYGIFSLSLTILNISIAIGALGLKDGTARQIAYYRAKKENEKVNGVISYSLLFGLLAGVTLFVLVFFSSDIISIKVFNLPELSFSLKVFSIAIPFLILINILIAILRGFGRTKEKIIFENILRSLLFISFLSFLIWIGFSFEWAITTYILSIIITCVVFVIYFIKKKRQITLQHATRSKDKSIGKELLIFSLPLLLVTILSQIMISTDTLMLGFFKTSDIVGLYNAVIPLGRYISVALAAMLFTYVPVLSELYANNKIAEMRRSYAILTKWLCAVTFPLAMVFVFFPNVVLELIFGYEYVSARTTLQILTIGFFLNNFMGPNGAALTAMGKTKFLMLATSVAACINVGLNTLLIPKYGINGAAIATVTALVSINIIRSIKVYSISRIHSLNKNNVKPILLSSILIFVIYIIAKKFLTITFWMLPILFGLFIILYGLSLLLTKSFDKEDLDMLLNIEKRIGLNFKRIKRLLKRFI
jgi:O-antigen/teichoic acid export membrane protein